MLPSGNLQLNGNVPRDFRNRGTLGWRTRPLVPAVSNTVNLTSSRWWVEGQIGGQTAGRVKGGEVDELEGKAA